MVKSGLYNCLFGWGTDKISTTPTVHRQLSSKPIIYKTFRLSFFLSDKPSKWIWDFHIDHISIISENSGEVKEYRITPIRHNPICQTLFLGYPDKPDMPDIQQIRFDNMSNIPDQIGLIWTISIQDDGLIPSQNRLRRLI